MVPVAHDFCACDSYETMLLLRPDLSEEER